MLQWRFQVYFKIITTYIGGDFNGVIALPCFNPFTSITVTNVAGSGSGGAVGSYFSGMSLGVYGCLEISLTHLFTENTSVSSIFNDKLAGLSISHWKYYETLLYEYYSTLVFLRCILNCVQKGVWDQLYKL